MKLYYVSLTFHYTKKRKKCEKFRGPFEHETRPRPPSNPPLEQSRIFASEI